MEIPTSVIDKYRPRDRKPGDPRNDREEVLSNFYGRGIQVRDGKGGFRDATPKEIAIAVAHVPTGDLWGFFQSCLRARSFSRLFWHLLKPKNETAR